MGKPCLQKVVKGGQFEYLFGNSNEYISTFARVGYHQLLVIKRKRGKKLREKRKKQHERNEKRHKKTEIDFSQFIGLDYEDSIFLPENLQETISNETVFDHILLDG